MKVVHQAFPGPPPPCVSHRGAYVGTARVIYYTLTPGSLSGTVPCKISSRDRYG